MAYIIGADPKIWIRRREGVGHGERLGAGASLCPHNVFKSRLWLRCNLAYFHAIVSYFSVINSWHTNSAEDTISLIISVKVLCS